VEDYARCAIRFHSVSKGDINSEGDTFAGLIYCSMYINRSKHKYIGKG
jgi:hypothetical protein